MTASKDGIDPFERMIYAALGLTSRALAETAEAGRLTLTQWRILALLDEQREPVTLSELATSAAVSLPSASRLVNRLAQRGLVEVSPHKDDARALRIALSAKGRRVATVVIARRRELVAQALGATPLPDSFTRTLRDVADRLVSGPRVPAR
jgi:DNA-binding MarR family transcriptional regulator